MVRAERIITVSADENLWGELIDAVDHGIGDTKLSLELDILLTDIADELER